jgi:hypothetical protein
LKPRASGSASASMIAKFRIRSSVSIAAFYPKRPSRDHGPERFAGIAGPALRRDPRKAGAARVVPVHVGK